MSQAYKTFNRKGDFLGFDVPPYHHVERPLAKNGIRVLSLFDGVATGLLALQTLRFEVEAYYSCEIAEEALQVQRQHYYNLIQPLGDVHILDEAMLDTLGRIDLLLGGSPCNNFSLANPHRKGLYGEPHALHLHKILVYCAFSSDKETPMVSFFSCCR